MSEAAWRGEAVLGFGRAVGGPAAVRRPENEEQLRQLLTEAGARGEPLALRGGGNSYGDASTAVGKRVVDCTGWNRILAFDAERGVARVEPGVTIRDLWRRAIAERHWPHVVPGTAAVTVGGACAMNIHGKNNFAAGSFGEHVQSFRLLTVAGETLKCSREEHADLFHAAIGGFGMLGVFTEIELRLKRVHSGRLKVWSIPIRDLEDELFQLDALKDRSDYLVSWVDLHARGRALGRGLLHRAVLYEPGEDPVGETMFAPERQDVPPTLFGVVPKGWIWPGMWCATKLGCDRFVNALRFRSGFAKSRKGPHPQTHGAFHFLLDYVPRWHWAFRPGGLIQFQPFIPAARAASVLRELIESCQQARIVPYLGVLKRHRPDPFLMTHAVDGFSMAMDFAVPASRSGRDQLWAHTRRLAERVLEAGGRFYWAKDATLEAASFARVHGEDAVARFRELKQRLDPGGVLQSDLSRRLLG